MTGIAAVGPVEKPSIEDGVGGRFGGPSAHPPSDLQSPLL